MPLDPPHSGAMRPAPATPGRGRWRKGKRPKTVVIQSTISEVLLEDTGPLATFKPVRFKNIKNPVETGCTGVHHAAYACEVGAGRGTLQESGQERRKVGTASKTGLCCPSVGRKRRHRSHVRTGYAVGCSKALLRVLAHGVDPVWFADTSMQNHWQFVAFKPGQIETSL